MKTMTKLPYTHLASTTSAFDTQSMSRRSLLAGLATIIGASGAGLGLFAGLTGPAHAAAAQEIADHFASVRTMTGEFVQLGPKGEQTGGKFFIQRPGKIRFNYEAPSNIRVIADGKSVVVNNKKLDTWDIYPLSKTPLKLLLDEKIDLSAKTVKKVEEQPDLTTIVLGNESIFGDARITMLFDPETFDLRQWTVTDAQGKDTTVMIFNVQTGVKIDPKLFTVDYLTIQQKKKAKGG
jgi:outer membrane lipoprotein-sorting protein